MNSSRPKRQPFSPRALLPLFTVVVVIVMTSAERFVDPVGEKYERPMAPGAADFTLTFLGSHALALGLDPYHNDAPELADPWKRPIVIDGRRYNVAYPPSHLLLYWPLAKLTEDPRLAGRIVFWLNLLAL